MVGAAAKGRCTLPDLENMTESEKVAFLKSILRSKWDKDKSPPSIINSLFDLVANASPSLAAVRGEASNEDGYVRFDLPEEELRNFPQMPGGDKTPRRNTMFVAPDGMAYSNMDGLENLSDVQFLLLGKDILGLFELGHQAALEVLWEVFSCTSFAEVVVRLYPEQGGLRHLDPPPGSSLWRLETSATY